MSVLQIEHLTKDYGHGRGVFDVSFNVEQGEVYGFLGPNGAGKTTTIRHIIGFSRPQSGTTAVEGSDSWKNYYVEMFLLLPFEAKSKRSPNRTASVQSITFSVCL